MAKYLSESPGVGKRVLDVEVLMIVEDSDNLPELAAGAEPEAALPPSDEMGIASRGTGDCATSAIMR